MSFFSNPLGGNTRELYETSLLLSNFKPLLILQIPIILETLFTKNIHSNRPKGTPEGRKILKLKNSLSHKKFPLIFLF